METDPDRLAEEEASRDADPSPEVPQEPPPEEQRGAPDGEGGTTAPLPGNPDVGGS